MTDNSQSKALSRLDKNRNIMYQVSLLQGLTYGDYCGSVSIKELRQHGDTGIGTFDRLNGELIMLDGRVYRAAGDGKAELVSDGETVPFCVVTFMDADESENLREIPDYDTLCNELDKIIQRRGKNRFYMVRIDGKFRKINVRSVYAQQKPYKRLAEVLTYDQTFFDYENTEGTAVGLYCPPYMSALNAVGWHLHFISADKTKGGHVLGLNIADARLTLADKNELQIRLPQNEEFSDFDFTVDQSADIEKIEKNK